MSIKIGEKTFSIEEFQTYLKGVKLPESLRSKTSLYITVSPYYKMLTPSKLLYERMGSDYVELLFNEENKIIVLKPTDGNTTSSIKMSPKRHCIVAGLMSELGVKAGSYTIIQEDTLFWFNYRIEEPVLEIQE